MKRASLSAAAAGEQPAILVITCLGAALLYVGTLVEYGIFAGQFQPVKPIRNWRVGSIMDFYNISESSDLMQFLGEYGLYSGAWATVGDVLGALGIPANQPLQEVLGAVDCGQSGCGSLSILQLLQISADQKIWQLWASARGATPETVKTALDALDPAKNPRVFRTPVPVISSMFEEWPLVSSCVVGMGATLMFMGIICIGVSDLAAPGGSNATLRNALVALCALCTVSIWMSMASVADTSDLVAGGGAGRWLHVGATGAFVVFSIALLFVLWWILSKFGRAGKRWYLDPCNWMLFWTIFASIWGVVIVVAAMVQAVNMRAVPVHYLLVASEFITLLSCGIASVAAVVAYTQIEYVRV